MEGVEHEAEEMKSALEYVTDWIKDSDDNSDAFNLWCVVAAMFRTGLSAEEVIKDSNETR